ncbi:MAG: hypothetical protein HZC04_01625 [Candidatus Lloydbacteria bacterium]|nr:hypothetical protein [Candidatus Lloydbacteria bacterium]
MLKQKGLFIALYGVNGVGKTTQALKLLERINKTERCARYIKFPNYTLLPTGPRINDYLRKGNPEKLTAEQFVELCAENRRDAEPRIKKMLAEGHVVVAEDWTPTGIVWGIATGVSKEKVCEMNSGFLVEDVSILLEGKPFAEGKEKGHTHEENTRLLSAVRKQYLAMAEEIGDWNFVCANQSEEGVHSDIWDIIEPSLNQQTTK